ncbi:polysaccharide pyruvyl transferase family protein [Gordonia sp. 852002-50395_SCH5434458]|uniref:polysaccharide pyruvyl transferase family protein n=1 Tax=unclassified Gordonia (in: high G+C Gram-positive bacteria) TaxID=2657482 RepID=UPI003FA5376A
MLSFGRSGPIRSVLRCADIVVDTGAGDSFSDIYGLKRLFVMVYVQLRCIFLGKPLVLFPQTIGPFHTRIGALAAGAVLERAACVIAREPHSADVAVQNRAQEVLTSTDLVFALPVHAQPTHRRDVVVNVSGLLWFDNGHVSSSYYREQTIDLVRQLNDRGRRVTLLAHVVGSPSGNDDATAIAQMLESGVKVEEVVIPTSLDQVRETLGSAAWVVGARMHACLNAVSQGVPAISWGYSDKFLPLMDHLGWHTSLDLRKKPQAARQTIEHIDSSPLGVDDQHLRSSLGKVRSSADGDLGSAVNVLRVVLGAVR